MYHKAQIHWRNTTKQQCKTFCVRYFFIYHGKLSIECLSRSCAKLARQIPVPVCTNNQVIYQMHDRIGELLQNKMSHYKIQFSIFQLILDISGDLVGYAVPSGVVFNRFSVPHRQTVDVVYAIKSRLAQWKYVVTLSSLCNQRKGTLLR